MKSTIKKVLSILIIIVVVLGWLFSFIGVGSFENLKSALKYGLDINGGVYVVMEADLSEIAEADIDSTMEQTREVLNRRVDAMGVANANVSTHLLSVRQSPHRAHLLHRGHRCHGAV